VRKTKRSVDKQQCLFTELLLETQEIAAANCERTKPPKKSYISWNWSTEKRIQMAELFDGRLARFGVLECLREKSPDIRVLTDEKSILS
jgi:hypothetical protein